MQQYLATLKSFFFDSNEVQNEVQSFFRKIFRSKYSNAIFSSLEIMIICTLQTMSEHQ